MRQARNIFHALTRNENSVFYGTDRITRTQVNKAKNSNCLKNNNFLGLYRELENENELYFDEKKQEATVAAYMPLVEQQKNIAHPSSLYSFKGPFALLHADITDIRFLAKPIVDPKYSIIFVDLSLRKSTPTL